MSVAGIATTAFSALAQIQRGYQSVQGEFKQLGQDLSSGNLSKAQTDFVTLSQSAASGLAANPSLSKALRNLGQALQSGDLSSARQAYENMPPIPAPTSVKEQFLDAHPPHPGVANSAAAQPSSSIAQLLDQVGQALQSGNLSAAQQVLSSMKQNWQQMLVGGVSQTAMRAVTSGVNVSA